LHIPGERERERELTSSSSSAGARTGRMIATPGVEQAALDLEQVRVDGSAEDPETKETTVEILI
jgi:hypothetical protein